ncbi:O-antigen ligase family protein [Nocardioides conyzicola]|uniref:O-antigen ligase-related domain-containing protein n=1 Tax=Nocardioides conyzicola TaxID=1651781 RepID=A0ABP8XGQ6_9ACTN
MALARLHALRDGIRTHRPERTAALPGTLRGGLWFVVVATDFFLLSNPLTVVTTFRESLHLATVVTLVMTVATLPWLRLPRPPVTILALLAWGTVSMLWSIDPSITGQLVLLYLWIGSLAVLVAANVDVRILVGGFATGGLAVILVSLYQVRERLPVIDYPLSYSEYLTGIGLHRNILSYTLAIAIAALLCTFPRRWLHRVCWIVALVILVIGIYLTESVTGKLGVVALAAVAVGLLAVRARDRRGPPWKTAIIVLAATVACYFAFSDFDALASSMDRDGTRLSGRIPLWQAVLHVADDRPFTGWGWGAVWHHPWEPSPPNRVADRIYADAGEYVYHGHNSLFDLLPEVGLIGVLLAVAVFAAAGTVAWRALRRDQDPGRRLAARFVLLALAAQVVYGFTEPVLESPLGWFCLVVTATVATSLRRAGRHRAPADRRPGARRRSTPAGH